MKHLKFIFVFLSVTVWAQTNIKPAELKVFSPDENSQKFNEVYTQNFFFGNLGLKQLMAAVPINNNKVKTLKISAQESDAKPRPIMEINYDKDGKITLMKVFEAFFGDKITVVYKYKDNLIQEEIITQKKGTKKNTFYYLDGKMIVENTKGILDVYSLNGKILYKTSYIDGKLFLTDKLEGNCRLTQYQNQTIDKVCFSNLDFASPLTIEEFTMREDAKGKPIMEIDQSLTINKDSELNYTITSKKKELYKLKLNKDARLDVFKFLGNKAEHTAAVDYKFNYIYY